MKDGIRIMNGFVLGMGIDEALPSNL